MNILNLLTLSINVIIVKIVFIFKLCITEDVENIPIGMWNQWTDSKMPLEE